MIDTHASAASARVCMWFPTNKCRHTFTSAPITDTFLTWCRSSPTSRAQIAQLAGVNRRGWSPHRQSSTRVPAFTQLIMARARVRKTGNRLTSHRHLNPIRNRPNRQARHPSPVQRVRLEPPVTKSPPATEAAAQANLTRTAVPAILMAQTVIHTRSWSPSGVVACEQ